MAQYHDFGTTTRRNSYVIGGVKVTDAKCELCGELVEKGSHYRRGWGLWVHAGCAVRVRDFLAKVTPPAPAPYVEEVEYADF